MSSSKKREWEALGWKTGSPNKNTVGMLSSAQRFYFIGGRDYNKEIT